MDLKSKMWGGETEIRAAVEFLEKKTYFSFKNTIITQF